MLAIIAAVIVDFAILPVTFALATVVTLALHISTVPLRIYPPDALSTFGDLAQRVIGVTVAKKQLHLGSVDAILHELRPIVVDTLGVDGAEVVLDARFTEDLGMG